MFSNDFDFVLSNEVFFGRGVAKCISSIEPFLINFLSKSKDYTHEVKTVSGSGKQAHELLPHVHMVDSLVKRWINGTHQGSISSKHLSYYLDEFAL
jgi:hypothetical protein